MNREILFKAKRKDNGEWVEGLPGYDIDGNITELEVYKSFCNCQIHAIDPDTLCQYTGLTDKNGEKIWENDIVRDKTGDIFRIYWSEQLLNYSAKCVKSTFSVFINQKWDLGTLLKSQIDVEVCGNIFDNAELLEVE